ncbi:XisI protein [Chroococcus sp. FPU101]|uniref:XisI protein n=1 Tax=Chroococcus sp. FPU101 TaxID=1974212 RepID=UPI001A8CFE69|nr:XisI protein [Chroococcus sp. FPU101]GFE67846.1 XisI protein [Chroococcus sp. FPU101]
MDKLNTYRKAIQKIIKHKVYQPSHGQIETLAICDFENDNYMLMDLGWDNTGRVHAVVFHLRIQNDKIWIEWDGLENGITQELLDYGIAKEDIVLGFYRPERRALTEFAIN